MDDNFAEEIRCEQCDDGIVQRHRSGWCCETCSKWICESCCLEGSHGEEDIFMCGKCNKKRRTYEEMRKYYANKRKERRRKMKE